MDERFSHERMFSRETRREDPRYWSDSSSRAMIATANYLATAAGVEILEAGGNAFDAAVAASFALGVCEPAGSGLGGMATLVAHHGPTSRTLALDGACPAPLAATPEAVAASDRYHGYRAIAVPTLVSTLDCVIREFCRLPAARLLEPAARLAEDGFPVTRHLATLIESYRDHLARDDAATPFIDSAGAALEIGATLRQPRLARTLRALSERGLLDFYTGRVGERICRTMRERDGFVARADLDSVPRPRRAMPLQRTAREGEVFTAGPPAGGVALLQMLAVRDALARGRVDLEKEEGVALAAAIIRRARVDRRRSSLSIGSRSLGGAAGLLDPTYASEVTEEILGEQQTRGETSHIAAMDSEGNAVSMTQSIERSFGAAVMDPELGFLYNGYLKAFKVEKPQHPHFLRPGAVARSNAAPTIVLRDGRPLIAIGSTGSERIASGIFLTLLRIRDTTPFGAVAAPRFHCTPRGRVLLEAARLPAGVEEVLLRQGFTLRDLGAYSFKVGGLQLVAREGDRLHGVGEPRRDGAAGGPRESRPPSGG